MPSSNYYNVVALVGLVFIVAFVPSLSHQRPSFELNDPKCGNNCMSGNCPNCSCGLTYAPASFAKLCANQGWENPHCCECIIIQASKGNSNAVAYNATTKTYSAGLFQISSEYWTSCNNGNAPCDVTSNFYCAASVYALGGKNFSFFFPYCHACGCCDEN